MANVKVVSERPLFDGMAITFKTPCECSAVEGLTVSYHDAPQSFVFRDAHGNDLTGIGNLFEEGTYVQAILDTVNGYAYLQNADTNGYLEHYLPKESKDYPGCFYRIVNGQEQWINPPMIPYKCYATTERYNGKVVWVTVGEFPLTDEDLAEGMFFAWIKESNFSIVGMEGCVVDDTNKVFFLINVSYSNGQRCNVSLANKKLDIECTSVFKNCTLRLLVKYTI